VIQAVRLAGLAAARRADAEGRAAYLERLTSTLRSTTRCADLATEEAAT
jgi:hypothetical protein